jgi:hypothetical protein
MPHSRSNRIGRIDVVTNRLLTLAMVAATVLLTARIASGQGGETFKARLSALPVDAITAPTMTGSGSVTAELQGNTLVIKGEFKDMNSPATVAHIHRALKGLRGPNVFDLTVTKAASGTLEGRLTLTAAQVADLNRSWYYVQIHTEKNPEGQLRGWLLK